MLTRRPSRAAGLAALAVAALLTAGCAAQTDTGTGTSAAAASRTAAESVPSAASSTEPAVATTSPAAATTEDVVTTSFPGNTDPDVADPVDPKGLTVTAVRAASHDGYDRVVFELSGSGTPGWSVQYVDAPSAQGSGAAIHVPGSAFLQVTLQGTSYPYDSGATEVARGPVPVSGTDAVDGVFYDATFEGTSVAFIGTDARTPFRVYSLTGPSRVVVEVAHAG